ncbi:hypothetical protein HPB52_014927 [Rhipicephalus sanguineus]|uniref:Uncharacterized protein n=1 Tax=Rhipicephalus sanguineus TaxID=34632 RepID=A0A9D4SSX6_RHISA|nr:hypothetical protein HPB52_014927 [Rhipicephalus sanguineus]
MAHFKIAASGDGTLSASAAASPSPAQRKAQKRFRIDQDVCILKEAACADPFGNPAAWKEVLRNVVLAAQRDLTIRAIKERVDLLVGYFRQQDTANLRKAVGGRKQLLQDISDLTSEADYVPRTVPRKGNGVGPPKGNGVGPRRTAGLSASTKAQKDKAMQIRDSAMSSIPVVEASDDAQTNGK